MSEILGKLKFLILIVLIFDYGFFLVVVLK